MLHAQIANKKSYYVVECKSRERKEIFVCSLSAV